MNEWLSEQLKTIRNLTDISILLDKWCYHDLLPTVLELLYQEIQQVIDENCIK